MIDEKVELLANDEVSEGFYLARLRAPHIAAEAVPGQFINIGVSTAQSPFLRMPLSICAVDNSAETADLLYESLGPKSTAFSRLRPGSVWGHWARVFLPRRRVPAPYWWEAELAYLP